MGARGSASSAAQVTVITGGLGRRPGAPDDLSDEQKRIWTETVTSEGAEFFNTAALRELLKDYCRHKTTGAMLTKQIQGYEALLPGPMGDDTLKEFDRITKMRDRETKAAADLATKLRLTNQSRYTPKAAATASKASGSNRKPWDTED